MGSQWGYDRTHIRAKHEGYRFAAQHISFLRSSISLLLSVFDDNIVDLGAAPGHWLQVERTAHKRQSCGRRSQSNSPAGRVETIEGDLNDPEVQEKVRIDARSRQRVVCDAAPPRLSGQKSYDQARIIELNEQALPVCC